MRELSGAEVEGVELCAVTDAEIARKAHLVTMEYLSKALREIAEEPLLKYRRHVDVGAHAHLFALETL